MSITSKERAFEMSQNNKNTNKTKPAKKKPNGLYIVAGLLIVAVAAITILKGTNGSGYKAANPATSTAPSASASTSNTAQKGGDIKITASQITSTATFIPYQSGSTKMEIIAVKAPDGTIRTAFNTCQVCYDSGRGYYVQQGDVLVCQNCGNRFNISQIEKEKNGCNPIPILEENKSVSGDTITIPASILSQNTKYFTKWKK
jgi:uncharacterized membrane protein